MPARPGDDAGTAPPAIGAFAVSMYEVFDRARPAASFYDGRADRRLVPCPDCSLPADVLFGDHGGDCRPTP